MNLQFSQKRKIPAILPPQKKQKRRRICFKLHFSLNIKAIIGKTFLKLLTVYFPKSNSLYKIFNKNMVKVSYSCLNYMSSIIWLHKKRPLRPRTTEYGCSFQTTLNCPLQNQYLMPSIIYATGVESNTTKGTKNILQGAVSKTQWRFKLWTIPKKHRTIKMYVVVKRGANNVWNQMVKCWWSSIW